MRIIMRINWKTVVMWLSYVHHGHQKQRPFLLCYMTASRAMAVWDGTGWQHTILLVTFGDEW